MAVSKHTPLMSILGLTLLVIAGCGSGGADTDTNTANLKAPLPVAKPGTVVDPPDPSKTGEGAKGGPADR